MIHSVNIFLPWILRNFLLMSFIKLERMIWHLLTAFGMQAWSPSQQKRGNPKGLYVSQTTAFFLLGAGVERVTNWQHSLQLLVFAESDAQRLVCWCDLGYLLRSGLLKCEALYGGARYYCTCSHCWWDRIASWIKRILWLRQVLRPSIFFDALRWKDSAQVQLLQTIWFHCELETSGLTLQQWACCTKLRWKVWGSYNAWTYELELHESTKTSYRKTMENLVIHEDSCRLDLNCR